MMLGLFQLMQNVVVFLGIFLVLRFLYNWFLAPRRSPLLKLPGLKQEHFIFGNMRTIFSMEAIDPYMIWLKQLKTSMYYYWHLFGELRVFVADADVMRHIMVTNVKNYQKPFFLFRMFVRVSGHGLLSLNGEEHLTQRKLCLGSFKSSILKNMIPSFQNHTESLLRLWRERLSGDPNAELNIRDDLHRMTLDVISECAFGYATNALENQQQPETRAFFQLLGMFSPSLLRFLMPEVESRLPTKTNKQFQNNLMMADNMIARVISNKRAIMEQSNDVQDENQCRDLLSMLLLARDSESGHGLSNKQLRDHVMTFMLAGHETTSTALSWCLLLLSKNLKLQQQVREEVESVLPPRGETITNEHVENMKFLNCCVKETLRLYPPAPMTFRIASNDDVIKGYHIPKDTIFNIHVGALHRNPEYWDEPEEFRPERFMDESRIKPYSYLPFVAGPRMCIGYKFALLETKVLLAMMIRDFEFRPIAGQTYKKTQRITMKPDPDLKLHAKYLLL